MSRSRLVALLLMCVALPVALLIVAAQGDDDSSVASDDVTVTTAAAAGPTSTVDLADLPEPGSAAPTFTLQSLDGKTVSLASYRGRPVVLAFFASWCHPCEEEFPLLEGARKAHAEDGLAVLAVAFNDREADTREFVERKGVHFPALLDPDDAVARAYRVASIPMTFFIDADGQIVERGFGLTQSKYFDPLLQELLDS